MLEGTAIKLRALEPEDLDFLYRIENDSNLWEYSTTQTPYSKFVLKQYLKDALRDIYEAKQLRLVITTSENSTLGMIDLFDFDPKNKRVGVGILIASQEDRQKGYAKEALQLLSSYAFNHLHVHQIYANIGEKNIKSIALFEKIGFSKVGTKKDWNFYKGKFHNELLYQLVNNQSEV